MTITKLFSKFSDLVNDLKSYFSEIGHTHTKSQITDFSHDHNYAASNSAGGPANMLWGRYTLNGGQQGPGYFGRERAGVLMSNATVNGDSHYKNWLYMDSYSGNDVGGTTAIGLDRLEPRAFLMQSDANRSAWNNSAELYSTAHKPTPSDIGAASSSHTHTVSQVSWPGGQNLTTSATANGQEWSIDLTPGSYTGTYWHVWSSKNAASILRCFPDDNKVDVPNGLFSVTKNGNTVTIGSQNGSWCHFTNSANINFYFNKSVHVDGDIYKYNGAKVSYEGHNHGRKLVTGTVNYSLNAQSKNTFAITVSAPSGYNLAAISKFSSGNGWVVFAAIDPHSNGSWNVSLMNTHHSNAASGTASVTCLYLPSGWS